MHTNFCYWFIEVLSYLHARPRRAQTYLFHDFCQNWNIVWHIVWIKCVCVCVHYRINRANQEDHTHTCAHTHTRIYLLKEWISTSYSPKSVSHGYYQINKKKEKKICDAFTVSVPAGIKTLHILKNTFISCLKNAAFTWMQNCYEKGIPIESEQRKSKIITGQLKSKVRLRI